MDDADPGMPRPTRRTEELQFDVALNKARANRFNAWAAINEQADLQYRQARGDVRDLRPLEALPCGIKDNIDVAGLPTASGSTYPPANPTNDAAIVRSLRRAGAVILGKNTMHEIAYGSTGVVSAHQHARNPRDPNRLPGGSSSGAAAAVAAGDVPFAIGTDTGGSVRVPAASCGVVGLRPTTHSSTSEGIGRLSPTLDTIGILANTVECADRVWSVLTGQSAPVHRRNQALNVGVVVGESIDEADPAVQQSTLRVVNALREHGYPVTAVRIGWLAAALYAYQKIVGSEAAWVHRERMTAHPSTFQPETLQRIMDGAQVPGWEYVDAMQQRDMWKAHLLAVFDAHDVMLCPTTPMTAPLNREHAAVREGRRGGIGQALVRYTAPWSLMDTPTLAVPAFCDSNGMPASVQIIGRPGDETAVLSAGAIVERIVVERY
jgi:Asp-tRNA(Asn)/Glu-tRNA(Gln) amidotransferase A subunit family amidase